MFDNPPVRNLRFLTATFEQGGLWVLQQNGKLFSNL